MKKVLATLLALAMIVTGFMYLNPNASEVDAATASSESSYITVAEANWNDSDKDGVPDLEDYLFAGYFKSEVCTQANKATKETATHAKFVKADTLDVKVQITNGVVQKSDVQDEDGNEKYVDKYVIRFVSSVESLDYSKIGFELELEDGTKVRNTSNKVFSRIDSTTGVAGGKIDTYDFSPKMVGEDSEYFMTAKLPVEVGNEGVTYKVRAFWKTLDGTEVFGQQRCVSINDSGENIINVTVDQAMTVGGAYTATYGPNAEGTGADATQVEVLSSENGHSNVRITLGGEDTALGLKSATKFVITGAEGTVKTIYRNYYTDVAGTADTSWYDVDPTATRFAIASVSDLYGLASIVNGKKDLFYQNEIHLVRSVEVNKGLAIPASEASDGVATWKSDTTPVAWTPIGNEWNADFRGIFDGDNNTISGLYISGGSSFVGLFGYAGINNGQNAEIANVRLTNSYFSTSYDNVGAIVSYGYGVQRLENVYSDAVLVASTATGNVGGLVGRLSIPDKTIKSGDDKAALDGPHMLYKNCWFDGEINSSSTGAVNIGGIMGALNNTYRLDMINCLYTGTINNASTSAYVGGLFSRNVNAMWMELTNCLTTGEFNVATNAKGGLFATAQHPTLGWLEMSNCYTSATKAWNANGFTAYTAADCQKTTEQLATANVNTLFPGHNGAWVNNVEDAQTPILSAFASWWSEKQYEAGLDTSWYDADATEYVITTAAQLNGLAELAKTNTFSGKTIKLGANIALNKADSTIVKKWVKGTAIADNMWTPIGTSDSKFAGTFDGQGFVISGLYLNATSANSGLFGETTGTTVIKNFKLVDSYMKTTTGRLGIVGRGTVEKIENIYTNAIMETGTGHAVAGMLGEFVPAGESVVATFSNCWFDGSITSGGEMAAGIVGNTTARSTITFNNCLNTGNISCVKRAGGILGYINNGWYVSPAWQTDKWLFNNCLSVGDVQTTGTDKWSVEGALIAAVNTNVVSLTVNNSYGVGDNLVGKVGSGTVPEGYLKTRNELIYADETELFPVLVGETENAWVSDGATGWNNTDRGTPILATFAEWWIANIPHDELTVDISWYNDNDTEFTLYDAADLNGLAELAKTNTFSGKTIKLGANIALNKADSTIVKKWVAGTVTPSNTWTPIGTSTTPFAGTFDGQGYTISGLYINKTAWGYYGLFGSTTGKAVIKNFKLVDSYMATTDGYLGVVGYGTVEKMENIYSNTTIKNVKGFASAGMLGALVPASESTLATFTNCWFDGSITSGGDIAAGIVGNITARATIEFNNCLNSGSISCTKRAGGILGYINNGWAGSANKWVFNNCLSVGDVETTGTDTWSVAGALVAGINTNANSMTVNHSYGVADKLVGKNSSGTVPSGYLMSRDEICIMDVATLFPGSDAWVNDNENGWDDTNRGTPILATFADFWRGRQPAFTPVVDLSWYNNNPGPNYELNSLAAVRGFAAIANTKDDFTGKTVTLNLPNKELKLNEVSESILASWKGSTVPDFVWTPIGTSAKPFKGTFDGNGHTISGLYLNATASASGVFGTTAATATIQNFKLIDSYMKSTGDQFGLIGDGTFAKIENVYTNAIMCSEGNHVGGFIGRASGSGAEMLISNCWFDGTITQTADTTNSKGTQGGVSGFVGMTAQTTGTRPIFVAQNCLNTGSQSGYTRVGGFIGWHAYGNKEQDSTWANCLMVGSAESDVSATACMFIGDAATSGKTIITNTYTTGTVLLQGGSESYVTYNQDAVKSRVDLYQADLATLFSGSTAWVQDTGYNDVDRGTPILATFAEWWIARQDEGAVEAAPSIAWYSEPVDGAYVIQNKGDLLGFLSLAKKGETFDEKTIKLGANITLNTPNVSEWKAGTDVPAYSWTPVTFNGNFDGQGHSISGIYVKSSSVAVGFFGKTAAGSSISNFRLLDSYVEQSYASGTWSHFTGSIVGDAAGDITNVYSNATMVSPCHYTSGIVGIMRPASVEGETVAINNCWFDGSIELTKEVGYIGGIVGYQENGTLNLTNVLYTGHIKGNRPTSDNYGIGGIIGQTYNTVTATNLESVVSAGTFDIPNGTKWIGSVVGYFYSGVNETDTSTYTLNNVFANRGWGTTFSWGGGNGTLTGQVIQTSNGDRLIGYVPQVARDIKNDTLLDAQKLDFTSAWTMRTNDVPIPTALKDVVDVRTIVSDATIATLTNELGLGTISGSLSNAVAEGAGDYVVTVTGTKTTYDSYLQFLNNEANGFKPQASNVGTPMEADGVYSATYYKTVANNLGEWVVNVTFVTNDGKIYVSLNSDVDSMAKTLVDDDAKNPIGTDTGTNAVALSMVEDKEAVNITGNCFVFQLPNGHFIINDGNTDNGSGAILKAYLQSQVGEGNPIYIDAWTISHFHNDHAGALMDFAKDASLRENVYLNALYANEPSAYGATIYETRTIGDINGAIQGAKLLTKSPTDNSAPDFYEVHMGQRYYFNGLTMDIVNTPEQIAVDTWTGGEKTVETHTPDPFNTSSVNFVFTLNETGKRVLIGGDSTKITMQYIIDAYGENNNTLANINVFAAYHHGKNAMNQYNFNNGSSYYPTSAQDGYVNAGKANTGWADFLLNNTNNESNKFDVMLFPFVKKFSTYKHTSTSTEDYYLGQYKNVYVGDDGSVVYPWNIGEINADYANRSNLHLTVGYEDSTSATDANPHGTVKITFNANGDISWMAYKTLHGQEAVLMY